MMRRLNRRLSISLFCLLTLFLSARLASAQNLLDPIPAAPQAQAFALPDSNGRVHKLSDYKNHFVLLNFWSMNCSSCRNELINLEIAYQSLREHGLEVVAVHAAGDSDAVKRYLKPMALSYTVLLDLDLTMGNWGVPVLPTTYLISPDGHLLYRASHPRDWGSYRMIEVLRSVMERTS